MMRELDTHLRSNGLAAKQQARGTDRRWSRYKVDVRVRLKLADGGEVYGRSTDISGGGMALFVGHELRLGQTIRAELILPYCTQRVELEGVVRNRDGFRYGVEFSRISDHDKVLLERVCRALAIVQ